MKWFTLILSLWLYGCGDSLSFLVEDMSMNNPDVIPGAEASLEKHLPSLPLSGDSSFTVWTGDWYPYHSGGTATRRYGQISALEKYDIVAGTQSNSWELKVAGDVGRVSWAGHCNGLAAASILTKEPTKGVTFRGVYFSKEDIKALLVTLWSGGGYAVGGRCNNKQVEHDKYGRITDPDCRDLNAGTFHVILANFLGIYQKPFIADQDPTDQVWNFPITSYQVLEQREIYAAEANKLITGRQEVAPDYIFNPNAKYWMYLRTQVRYTNKIQVYEYVLEGDANGYIVGGEWAGQSKENHPDFLWRHSSPTPDNPYINASLVGEIQRWSL